MTYDDELYDLDAERIDTLHTNAVLDELEYAHEQDIISSLLPLDVPITPALLNAAFDEYLRG